MRRILWILVIVGSSMAFDIRGLLVVPAGKGDLALKYRWTRTSNYMNQESEYTVLYKRGNPNSLTLMEGEKVLGTLYYDDAGKIVKQEIGGKTYEGLNLDVKGTLPEYKVVERRQGNLKGKSCTIVESRRNSEQEDTKGHLVMVTQVNSTKVEYYDGETGVLLRQEVNTDVLQKTYTTFDRSKPLNTRQNRIQEVLELIE